MRWPVNFVVHFLISFLHIFPGDFVLPFPVTFSKRSIPSCEQFVNAYVSGLPGIGDTQRASILGSRPAASSLAIVTLITFSRGEKSKPCESHLIYTKVTWRITPCRLNILPYRTYKIVPNMWADRVAYIFQSNGSLVYIYERKWANECLCIGRFNVGLHAFVALNQPV